MNLSNYHLRHIRHFTKDNILLLHGNTCPCKNRDDECFTLIWGHLYEYVFLCDVMVTTAVHFFVALPIHLLHLTNSDKGEQVILLGGKNNRFSYYCKKVILWLC